MHIIRIILLVLLSAQPALSADVRVVDGDTLIVSGNRYRLHGIDTPEHGQKCKKANGGSWRYVSAATKALQAIVAGKSVKCDNRGIDDYGRIIAVCIADGININETLIRDGFAWAFTKFSRDYVALEQGARDRKSGIWQADTETPWAFRAKRWEVGEQTSPEGCPIKGNISKNGMIYHAPWSPWYSRTKISLKKGERWFCSEKEALEAGWRAPLWGG